MEFWYPDRKSWMLASIKLDQNISSSSLELYMIIESSLREGAKITAMSVMAKSSSRLVSPAKTLFVRTMGKNSSCRTLKPLPFCASLMQLLQYNKEGLSAKSTWQIYSAKDLLISNIGTISQANGSLVYTFLRIAMTTTIIENGLEGIVRSGLRVWH